MTRRERPQPPTVPGSVVARRVLVLAPHYDDEVLGCGGLLLQLAASDAEIVCAFLSDGSGGAEGPPEGLSGEQYSALRRVESEAATADLGVARVEHVGHRESLPDGGLVSSMGELTGQIGALLDDIQPDLVLVPSPLEVTTDHQATFRALHEALIAHRLQGADGSSLAALPDDSSLESLSLQILCYEVNHPFYPDLLVDVSAEVDGISAAMSHYRSQQERHDYLESCLGLRRFRAHSLPRDCRFVEGYCQLKASDFTTRSPAQLIAHLGGAPALVEVDSPRRVSIVVRTFNRPRRLAEALESLARSTYRNVEAVLVNDGGRRPEVSEDFPFALRLVDHESNRGRAAAAQSGVEAATGDCIGFLDDDDLLAPEHLESLTAMLRGDVDVAYSDAAVVSYEPSADGWRESSRGLPYSRDFDRGILLLDNYIPFHTVLMTREALERAGSFDLGLPAFEDWDLLIRLSRWSTFVHLSRTTCEYRHFLGGSDGRSSGGHALGGAAAERQDFEALKARVMAKYADELEPDVLAGAVIRMRREAVLAAEAARAMLRETRATLRETRALLRETQGELELVQASNRTRGAEVERLHDRERDLMAEIEKMKATRAWRLHETLQSLRGSG